jgi:hypothetical protein
MKRSGIIRHNRVHKHSGNSYAKSGTACSVGKSREQSETVGNSWEQLGIVGNDIVQSEIVGNSLKRSGKVRHSRNSWAQSRTT